ncbi:MAG: hypothetical protein C0468_04430 [Planctomyces sp.]|nr:hypothetical protein [Planctomyces sp.]
MPGADAGHAGPGSGGVAAGLLTKLDRIAGRALAPAALHLGKVPAFWRQTAGWVAAVTFFNALVVWSYVMLSGDGAAAPAPVAHAEAAAGGGHGPAASAADHGAAPKKDDGHGPAKAKDAGHGAAKKKDPGHGAPAKKADGHGAAPKKDDGHGAAKGSKAPAKGKAKSGGKKEPKKKEAASGGGH